jgi:hypothetical protein
MSVIDCTGYPRFSPLTAVLGRVSTDAGHLGDLGQIDAFQPSHADLAHVGSTELVARLGMAAD